MGARILVVDDDDLIRRVLERYLSQLGYSVRSVSGGRQALESCKREPPQLIVLDVRMPDMDGMAVLKAVREFDLEVPVLVLTGVSDEASAKEMMRLGAYDYILKPFEPEYLETSLMAKLIPAGNPSRFIPST